MDKLVLQAVVAQEQDSFLAWIENLSLTGRGKTAEEAQEGLIERFRSWVEGYEVNGTLEEVLAKAGFPGVDEDTELELTFVKQ